MGLVLYFCEPQRGGVTDQPTPPRDTSQGPLDRDADTQLPLLSQGLLPGGSQNLSELPFGHRSAPHKPLAPPPENGAGRHAPPNQGLTSATAGIGCPTPVASQAEEEGSPIGAGVFGPLWREIHMPRRLRNGEPNSQIKSGLCVWETLTFISCSANVPVEATNHHL